MAVSSVPTVLGFASRGFARKEEVIFFFTTSLVVAFFLESLEALYPRYGGQARQTNSTCQLS